VLVTGEGLDDAALEVSFGGVPATIGYATEHAIVVLVPSTLAQGTVSLRLSGDLPAGSFEVIAELPPAPWTGPPVPELPIPVLQGYINPLDKDWLNAYDDNDARYFFQIAGDTRDAAIVQLENNAQAPPISGTYDTATKLLRFGIQFQEGVTTTFTGVYSKTDNPTHHELVFFPEANAGPQLVVGLDLSDE
jgi:hypothetical protein